MSYAVQTSELILNHVSGYNSSVNCGLQFYNEKTVMYTSGNVVVFQNIDTKTQKFLVCDDATLITAMATNVGKKFLAIGDKSPVKPIVTVYDLSNPKKKKNLTAPESLMSTRYEGIAFSLDSKLLVAQGNQPSWTIVLWMWQRNQYLHSINLPANCEIYQISFVPMEMNQILCTGKGICRTYRYFQSSLRFHAAPKHEQKKRYLCQAWLKNQKVAIGTDEGTVIIHEGAHVKMEIRVDCNDISLMDQKLRLIGGDVNDGKQSKETSLQPVRCIVATNRGFACTYGEDTVILYNVAKDGYRPVRTMKLPKLPEEEEGKNGTIPEAIVSLDFSPIGSHIVAGTSYNQLYCCSLIQADLQMNLHPTFEFLSYPFNFGRIKDLDVAVWKPLVASCTANNYVYLWDYYNYTSEMRKLFNENVFSISIHPFGLFLLIGFRNHFDIYLITLHELKPIKTFLTTNPCNQCAFSERGERFAIAQGAIIEIYLTVELERLFELKGHYGTVTSLVWCDHDTVLFSCSTDGIFVHWNAHDGFRENESFQKNCKFLCVAPHRSGTSYVIGDDRTIKEISQSVVTRSLETRIQFTSIVLSLNELLFCGTETGRILSVTYPLYDLIRCHEYPVHNSEVVKMKVSRDEKILITASADGDIFVWNIIERQKKLSPESGWILASETITSKEELASMNDKISSLFKEMKDLIVENEYRVKVQKMTQAKTHQDQIEKYCQEIESLNEKLKEINEEDKCLLSKHEALIDKIMSEQKKELEEREQSHTEKLRVECNLCEELRRKKEEEEAEYEAKIKELKERNKTSLDENKYLYQERLDILTKQLASVKEENVIIKSKTDTLVSQIQDDADEEILGYRMKYLKQVQEQKKRNVELEAETETLKKKVNTMKQKLEIVENVLKKKRNEEETLRANTKKLQTSLERAKENLNEKECGILKMEERIRDIGKSNDKLKKLNFLLKFDVQEKARKLKPLDEENDLLHKQSKSLEEKIANFEQNNRNLRCKVKLLKMHLRALEDDGEKRKEEAFNYEVQLLRYRTEISRLMRTIQNPSQLKDGVAALYRQQIISQAPTSAPEADRSIFDSYGSHLEHSEAKLQSLRDKMLKDITFHKVNYRKMLKERSDLILEINELRKELSTYRSRLRDFEKYFGVRSGDLSESVVTRVRVDEALRLDREGKKLFEKTLLERDKLITNQGMEIHKLHNEMRFNKDGSSKLPVCYKRSPIPFMKEGSELQEGDAKKKESDVVKDKPLSPTA